MKMGRVMAFRGDGTVASLETKALRPFHAVDSPATDGLPQGAGCEKSSALLGRVAHCRVYVGAFQDRAC